MRRREEYRSKITDDNGLTRGRVPCPLLREIGARPGDLMVFRMDKSGRVAVRLARARKKSAKRSKRR
jgi:hypothetical protein